MGAISREIWREDPSFIISAERGAVAPVPGRPGVWWVRGTEQVYEVNTGQPGELTMGSCECPGWNYRGHCHHLDCVAQFCGQMRRVPRISEWVQICWFGEVIWRQRELREVFA